MLSFEIIPQSTSPAIQIHCDEAGVALLIEALERLRERGHVHLRTPSNGGRELSETNPFGQPAIGEVIVSLGGD
jgi:hypothetical protein